MAPAKRAAKKTAKKAATKKTAAKKTAKKATKKTAAKRTAKKATSGGNAPSLVVGSRVKEAARARGVRVSAEFTDAFNGEVAALLERAVSRAEGNKRGTLRPQDL